MSLVLERDAATSQERLQQRLGPFSRAFRDGHWLLLDELNLAPDTVLQCIEQALDTGVLQLPGHGSEPGAAIRHAEGFRLFATLNPNSGGAGWGVGGKGSGSKLCGGQEETYQNPRRLIIDTFNSVLV